MDVETAFLNGGLEEEIYIEQPEGFVIPGQKNKVRKLMKSFYSLKQVPKQWHTKFDFTIIFYGFALNNYDRCAYNKFVDGKSVIVCFCVDDLLIFAPNMNLVNNVKNFLYTKVIMKDLGEANVILGIKFTKSVSVVALSQSHYIEEVLEKYGYLDCQPIATPYDPGVHLKKTKVNLLIRIAMLRSQDPSCISQIEPT